MHIDIFGRLMNLLLHSRRLLLTLWNSVALLISVRICEVSGKLSRKSNIINLKNFLLAYLFGLLCILIYLVGSWICFYFYILDDCLCLWNCMALLISGRICAVSGKLSRKFGLTNLKCFFWLTHIDIFGRIVNFLMTFLDDCLCMWTCFFF